MKYIFQFLIIAIIAFLGEVCYKFIPVGIPASIYGLLILAICLFTGIIKVEQIDEASSFLLEIMPILFVPPAVALVEIIFDVKNDIIKYLAIVFISTIVVIVSTGLTAEFVIKKTNKKVTKNIEKKN